MAGSPNNSRPECFPGPVAVSETLLRRGRSGLWPFAVRRRASFAVPPVALPDSSFVEAGVDGKKRLAYEIEKNPDGEQANGKLRETQGRDEAASLRERRLN